MSTLEIAILIYILCQADLGRRAPFSINRYHAFFVLSLFPLSIVLVAGLEAIGLD